MVAEIARNPEVGFIAIGTIQVDLKNVPVLRF